MTDLKESASGGGSMAWPALWVGGFREAPELTGAQRGPGPLTCLGPDSLPGFGWMPGQPVG